MNPFLATQADDPLDPTPMLILADWLEECGNAIGASVLRSLAESGSPSLHALALWAAVCSAAGMPDAHWYNHADGSGDGDGVGCAILFMSTGGFGHGGGADLLEDVYGNGTGVGADFWCRDEYQDNEEAFVFDV